MRASSVIDVILGEAGWKGGRDARFEDMKAIASVVVNRAKALGVSMEDVVQRTSEFNAYNKPLPSGVNAYRNLAEKAVKDVLENGSVHKATFYATPDYTQNLPKGLKEITRTKGHVYFTDPQKRAIKTRIGTKPADYGKITSGPLRSVDRPPVPGLQPYNPIARQEEINNRRVATMRLGGALAPTQRPAGMGTPMPKPTQRASLPGRPGLPTPTSRPEPPQRTNFAGPAGSPRSQQAGLLDVPESVRDRMAPQPASLPASVQQRMNGFPDRPTLPDLPAASRMIAGTAPSVTPSPMTRADAQNLPAGVMDRMAGFDAAPTPTARPSMMDRAAGLFSMDAKAATIPGAARLSPDDRIAQATQHGAQGSWAPTGATGSWAPAPTSRPNFAGPAGSPRAAGVPDYQAPSARPYSPPPSSYQSPAFSTAMPQIDALGQPPIPGLQRAPTPPSYQSAPPSYPAPREVAAAPRVAGPVGQVRQDEQPQRGNIPTGSYVSPEQRMADMVARSRPQPEAPGLFSGGFSGPKGVLGGALLGGSVGGLPGALLGGLLGSQSVRSGLGLGDMGRDSFQNDWSPAVNPGGGVVVNGAGRPTYSLANGSTTTPTGTPYDPWSGMRGNVGVSAAPQEIGFFESMFGKRRASSGGRGGGIGPGGSGPADPSR
ncbi:cell wall hydrolase [Aurantimonas sp. A3-2-R12]|uniref:cell wall hydrolase n=1 Tax=Aurantimonas sp. A3-2-R12 TaxID=3114362 RepID=UPI002E18620B|nr:cell wall hydrolase [Aurantimonas sp. A3-2-R12]